MEILNLQKNVPLLCRRVPTFPLGITGVFDSMMHDLPNPEKRIAYGISYMDEKGNIVYKAALSALPGDDAKKYSCEAFTIPKGEYLGETILNWLDQTSKIKDLFGRLLKDPRFDNSFPCVEWYKSDKELFCMVKTK